MNHNQRFQIITAAGAAVGADGWASNGALRHLRESCPRHFRFVPLPVPTTPFYQWRSSAARSKMTATVASQLPDG